MDSLVKLLKEKKEISELTEENISEYLQTKQTINNLKKLITEPISELAKNEGPKVLYNQNGLVVELKEKISHRKPSDKEVVEGLESFLENTLRNNINHRRMHGVRRFQDTITVSANYLKLIFEELSTGFTHNKKTSLAYKGKDAANRILEEYKGNLIMHTLNQEALTSLDDKSILTYVSANEEIKLLNNRIINPFESVFKKSAEKDPENSVFDNAVYGGLIVQVKSVPRLETKYGQVKERLEDTLETYKVLSPQLIDSERCYFNVKSKDFIYVDINLLLKHIGSEKEHKELKYRQEINILYKPETAIILSK